MKKRDIWISLTIIAVVVLLLFLSSQSKGQIKIDSGSAVSTLQLKSSLFGNATITSADQPCEVSARLYRPQRLNVSMKHNGETWQLESHGPWGELSTIRVKDNDTTVLALGPPFQIKPQVRFTGTKVSIDFNIFGKAGEQYYNVIMINNKRARAPRVKILDEDGLMIAAGSFEYG